MMLRKNISFFHLRDLIYNFFVYSKLMSTEKNFLINGLNYKYKLSNFHLSCLIEKFIEKKEIDPRNIAVALNEKLLEVKMVDKLSIDGVSFESRLIMGTSLFPNIDILNKSLEKSGSEIITMAVRRLNISGENDFIKQLNKKFKFLPNTAGCFTKKEAILTAELARELLQTNWIKLELISDEEMLLPDPIELFETCKELIKKGFKVFAYCSDDPVLCKWLEDEGGVSVMPLISPIGSGLGIRNVHNLEIIRNMCSENI